MVQSLSMVLLHIVFSTREREKTIHEAIASEMYPFISKHLENIRCYPFRIGGYFDHIHVLCALSRTLTVAKLVEEIKVSSSKFVKTRFNEKNFYWQNGYAVFSVSEDQKFKTIRYIDKQFAHHSTVGYIEELKSIIQENNISFSETNLL